MRIKPKKSLGQNFLVDRHARERIIRSCAFTCEDTILEIGSGRGELTALLAKEAKLVYALEIDKALSRNLKKDFKGCDNVRVICHDILQFDIGAYFSDFPGKIKVFGNLPYYITSPIIELLFRYKNKIAAVFITVQKEFAQRIVAGAGDKNYGAFSCFVQYFSEPKKLFYIKKGSFAPVPKVDSCFLRLAIRQEPAVRTKDRDHFFKIIRAAFNQRRKTLKNSLKGLILREKIEEFLRSKKLSLNIRPEDLSLQDFADLANL